MFLLSQNVAVSSNYIIPKHPKIFRWDQIQASADFRRARRADCNAAGRAELFHRLDQNHTDTCLFTRTLKRLRQLRICIVRKIHSKSLSVFDGSSYLLDSDDFLCSRKFIQHPGTPMCLRGKTLAVIPTQ